MQFQIDIASRTPIYRQLVGQIREAVARGRLAPEERLPSVRDLSRTLPVKGTDEVAATMAAREPTRGGWARELGWCKSWSVGEQLRHQNQVGTSGGRH